MNYHTFLSVYLAFMIPYNLLPVRACGHHNLSMPFDLGTDGPADPATLGYTMNHFSLLVNDIDASTHFYGDILGMRRIFTYYASETYQVVYMGFSHGGKNGTGYQTGEELLSEKTNIEGLIELLYNADCNNTAANLTASTQAINTFSHVGMVVPDVNATQARMDQYGVNILKRVGEDITQGSKAASAYGFPAGSSVQEARAALAGIDAIGFDRFLLVADPDGNLVEFQSQS